MVFVLKIENGMNLVIWVIWLVFRTAEKEATDCETNSDVNATHTH